MSEIILTPLKYILYNLFTESYFIANTLSELVNVPTFPTPLLKSKAPPLFILKLCPWVLIISVLDVIGLSDVDKTKNSVHISE